MIISHRLVTLILVFLVLPSTAHTRESGRGGGHCEYEMINGVARFTAALVFANSEKSSTLPGSDSKSDRPADARSLLERGQAAGSFPEGMIVRVSACLGAAEKTDSVVPEQLLETWEFTPNHVHRVVRDYKGDRPVYQRVESRSFDSNGLCGLLLDGKAVAIQERKGEGPRTGLVGTPYRIGSRTIEVEWNGRTILDLYETNGPTLNFYRQDDARAFGALYEKLAGMARDLFKGKVSSGK